MASEFSLKDYGITVGEIYGNLSPSFLYEHAIRYEKDASIAENGALVAYSGTKTGRSPADKRVVKNPASENEVWWGPVNIPLDHHSFEINVSARSTISIPGAVSIVSMASPGGIRSDYSDLAT